MRGPPRDSLPIRRWSWAEAPSGDEHAYACRRCTRCQRSVCTCCGIWAIFPRVARERLQLVHVQVSTGNEVCARCGQTFGAGSHRDKYCAPCRPLAARAYGRRWKARTERTLSRPCLGPGSRPAREAWPAIGPVVPARCLVGSCAGCASRGILSHALEAAMRVGRHFESWKRRHC